MFPKKIKFKSDDCVCELKSEVIENKIKMGVYVYKNGFYFKDSEIKFSEERIKELLRKEIITILK